VVVFAIERLASDDHRALEWRHSVVRGDRYSFVARWSADGVATGMEPSEG
jgi:GntR family transcriptional regulator